MFQATALRAIAPRVLAHAQRVLGDGQRWCATCHCAVRADNFEQHQGSPTHKRAAASVRRIRGQALELWERHRGVAAVEAEAGSFGGPTGIAPSARPGASDALRGTATPPLTSATVPQPRRRIFDSADSQFRGASGVTWRFREARGLHPLSPTAEMRADATARANRRMVASAEAAREPRILKAHQVERAGQDAVQLSGTWDVRASRQRGAPSYWASRH